MAETRCDRWTAPVLLGLFTLFFYWKILFLNRYMFPWDASDFFYPYFTFVHEELRHLRFPFWNPYSMGGSPIIADPEAQIFYPPAWLLILAHPFSALPFKWYEALEIAHFFLAGLFMFYLARDFTRDTTASLLGGILFMSSGAMVAHTEHVATVEAMAWYPLVFLLARRGLLYQEWRWTIWAGVFLGIGNLVGHWQHSVYLGMLLFLYFAYEALAGPLRRRLWPSWALQLAVIGGIGAGLAMVQIVPTSELSALSIRTQITYWDVTHGNDPSFLWTAVLPNYFGGLNGVPWLKDVEPSFHYIFLTVPGCLLALIGLIEMVRRKNFFWLGLILLTVDLSLGRSGYLAQFLFKVPVLNLFRQPPVYFDLGSLALCLMAAFGMKTLTDRDTRGVYSRQLPPFLGAVLAGALAWGLLRGATWKIPGWYHALAVLALTLLVLLLWDRGRIRPRVAQYALAGLVIFELCQYSMNQVFNWSMADPRTTVAQDYALGSRESVDFLRQDASINFRIAALDGFPWGTNGCNSWRLRCVLGWNPLMLRGYQEYLRQIFHLMPFGQPVRSPNHRLESPLVDLLGIKYLIALAPDLEKERVGTLPKFEKVFSEGDWRMIYRNRDYIAKGGFYPRAYVLPAPADVLALMNSRWFRPRNALLFSQQDVPVDSPNIRPIDSVEIDLDRISGSASGSDQPDDGCADSENKFRNWNGQGSWVRFDTGALRQSGRYALLLEYAAAADGTPVLLADIVQDGRRQVGEPRELANTAGWSCRETRYADLGEFELGAGDAQIILTLQQNAGADLFGLRLIRLPNSENSDPAPASDVAKVAWPSQGDPGAAFGNYSISANRIYFQAEAPDDGYLLLNENYYPGWEATVDGKAAEILRADHIFRALAVPAGTHRIEMRFRPRHFWLGAAVSLLTLVGLACYFTLERRRRRSQPSSSAAAPVATEAHRAANRSKSFRYGRPGRRG